MVERLTPLTPASVGTAARWWQRWPDCGGGGGLVVAVWRSGFLVVGGRGIPVRRENDPGRTVDPRRCAGRNRRTDHRFPGVSGHGNSGGDGLHVGARRHRRGDACVRLGSRGDLGSVDPRLPPAHGRGLRAHLCRRGPVWVASSEFFRRDHLASSEPVRLHRGWTCWAATALAYQRRSRGARPNCGRTGESTDWTTPANAARWGKWAVAIAVLIPLLYAATRWAWALAFSGD